MTKKNRNILLTNKRICFLIMAFCLLLSAIYYNISRPEKSQRIDPYTIFIDEAAAMEGLAGALEEIIKEGCVDEAAGQAAIDCTAQWGYTIHKKKQFSDEELKAAYLRTEIRIEAARKRIHNAQKEILKVKGGKSLLAQMKKLLADAKRAQYSKAPGHHH